MAEVAAPSGARREKARPTGTALRYGGARFHMIPDATNPEVGASGSGKICSLQARSNNPDHKPPKRQDQAEIAAATAPLILDLNYWNVELDLRLAAVKAVQAATDLEIGEPDDIAERSIRVAIRHLKDAAQRFRQIKDAKSTLGDAIIAGAFR